MSQNAAVKLPLNIGQPDLLHNRCGQCKSLGPELHKCAGCATVRYRCRDHQMANWYEHKLICETICAATTERDKEAALVQSNAPHVVVSVHRFQADVGQIQLVVTSRKLQHACFHLADSARKVGTLDGIIKALRYFLPMVQERPVDYPFVQGIIPTMMLQMDSDQDACALIKLWSKAGTSLTRPRAANSNVYENVSFLNEQGCDVNLVCATSLLKIKLIMDMRNIRIVRKIVPSKFPAEVVAGTELAVIRSPLSIQNLRLTRDAFRQRESELNKHILQLGRCIHKANGHFWKAFLDPSQSLVDSPGTVTVGSPKHASFMVQHNYAAWYQTKGVIPTMKCALAMNEEQEDMHAMWSNFKAALEF